MAIGIVGGVLVKLAFCSALAGSFFYWKVSRSDSSPLLRFARNSYHLATASLMSAAAILLYLILTHQYQYAYVWNYSSSNLSLPLLISTFYAGQEGSFTL